MKVTDEPAHIVVALAVILTAGVSSGFTVIVTTLLVAFTGEAQVALLVTSHVTTSPFTNAALL